MIALALRYWWAIAIAALLLALGAEHLRANNHKTAFAQFRLAVAQENARAEKRFRAEEQRRIAAVEEEAAHARAEQTILEGDVVRLADVADGLRNDLAEFRRRAARVACPANGSPGKPDTRALDLLADLYGRADQEAGVLAEYADRLRIVGGACERTADKVRAR